MSKDVSKEKMSFSCGDHGAEVLKKMYYDRQLNYDLTVQSNEQEFRCHKSIMAAQSEYFQKTISINDTIFIADVEPNILKLIVRVLSKKYTVPSEEDALPRF